MDRSNQKCRVAPLHNNHSDVQLIAGCGVGGIKAARLTNGLETGTGEPDLIEEFLPTRYERNGRANCRIPYLKERAMESGADVSVVVMKCWKQHGAKGSTASRWL